MRLHALTLEAFGPFPGREHLDFDALDQGILLVNGPTGSGKSSLLDAVTFALFGDVAGSRRTLRQSLRSHHAPPDRRPSVELTFSVGPQRWRILRTPQWDAPKKRGTGTTSRPAAVQLSRWRDGEWHTVSTRIDEATQTITDVLGMGLDQFAQVVLLPQGEFAEFLRARPEDRRILLERLFDVERFEAVERWFVEARAERLRACEASLNGITTHMGVVRETVERLDDPAVLPPEWETDEIEALPGRLRSLIGTVRARAEHSAETARRDAAASQAAERAVDQAEALLERHRAYHQALTQLQDNPASEVERMRRAIEAASAVAGVLAAVRRQEQAQNRAETSTRAMEAALHRLGQLTGHVGEDARSALDALPEDALGERSETLAELGFDLPRAAEALTDVLTAQEAATAATENLNRAQERADRDAQALETSLEGEHSAAAELAAMPDVSRERDVVQAALTLLARVPERSREIEHAQQERDTALTAFREAERHVIELRSARLESIAGELAADLAPGTPCPVCGAVKHPAPAQTETTAPTPEQIAEAERIAAEADGTRLTTESRFVAARTAREELVSHLDARLSELQPREIPFRSSALVEDPTPLEEHLCALEGALEQRAEATAHHASTMKASAAARETAARSASALSRAQAQAEASHEAVGGAMHRWNAVWEQLAAHHARLCDAPTDSATELPRLDLPELPARPHEADATEAWSVVRTTLDSLASVVEAARVTLQQIVTHREALVRAWEGHLLAQEQITAAQQEVASELATLGYGTLAEARAVALTDDALRELRDSWQRALEARAAATTIVEDEIMAAAAHVPAPRVTALRDRAQVLSRSAATSGAEASRWHTAVETLESLRHRVADAVRHHLPLAEAAQEVSGLADTVTGIGENTRRMRLTSYVLAAHLESVTAMANERLHHMTDGRYQLQYTDERAKGTQRSGLGLLVVDAWTGRSRDTATLSGGEAFMASLALALGLGDAVRADSGGMDLHTLFVDEGFGSLDQDTLEQVMEVLDGLREGGRLVGVVSHVSELRARIPTRIDVIKTAEGSRIRTEASARSLVFEPPIDGLV